MKSNFKRIAVLAAVIAALIIWTIPFSADLGDYSGDSDFGGFSDWGSSSDTDYDYDSGADIGNVFFLGDGGGGGSITVIILIILALFIYFKFIKGNSGNTQNHGPVAQGATGVDRSTLRPIAELKAEDPLFSEDSFKEKLSNLYVQMQNCCTAKDLAPLRPYVTDNLYAQFDRQVDLLRKANQTNRIDRISVLGVDILGYNSDGANNTVYVEMRTRITDYIIDDRTGALVRGSNTAEKFMVYEWALIRSKGKKTSAAEENKVVNCPNCGAPVNVNHTARCEYCNSIITTNEFDWALSSVKAISQRTSG